MRRPVVLSTLLPVAVLACVQNPPATTTETDTGSLSGEWTVEFSLDSVRRRDSMQLWTRSDAAPVRGSLEIADSSGPHGRFHRSMSVSFVPLLGHEMSCYSPGAGEIAVEKRSEDEWWLWFTPGVADCGFGGTAKGRGDTLRGTWSDQSLLGSTAEGHFTMVRRR